MATTSKKTGFPEFFADTESADNLRRQFIEAPAAAVAQSAIGTGLELANLFSVLPAAFVASQQRELDRIKQEKVPNDPRVAALEQSIEQAGVLQVTAQRAQVRVERGLVAVAGGESVFHGFVSDAQLAPLSGVTVRVTGVKGGGRSGTLSTTTDDEGYFSIPLGKKSDQWAKSGVKGNRLDRIAAFMAMRTTERGAEKSAAGEGAHVEILKKGKPIHSDPASLAVDQGSVYREYVVDETKPASAQSLKNFGAGVAAEAKERAAEQPKATADTSKAAPAPVTEVAEPKEPAKQAKKSSSKK